MAFEGLTQRLQQAFGKMRGKGKLTEEDVKLVMREVRMALLEADVNYKVVKDFVKRATERCIGQETLESLSAQQQIIKIVNEELTALMGVSNARLQYSSSPVSVFMLCGLQGAGKTTMSAKLANYLRKDGKRPLLVACDIYRPAAIKQLQVVGGQVNVPVFERGTQDPVETAREAVAFARSHQHDVVILDTAGRLHIDEALMDELARVREAVQPSEILLTIDAMTGQDAVNVANTFNEKLEITGVILTKLDGDTRGGAALSVRAVTGKPIKFAGTGEKLGDIEPFHPERMASRILGMGDVMTLIEKAQENLGEADAEQTADLARRMKNADFTLDDFLKYTGSDMKAFRENYRGQAEKSVKAHLVLEAIEKAEAIDATQEQIDKQLEAFAAQTGKTVEEFKASLSESDIEYFKADAIRDNCVKFLADNAKIEA